jgi:hypothetical protein
MEHVIFYDHFAIFYDHLEYFIAFWYGFTFWYVWTKKNLATLAVQCCTIGIQVPQRNILNMYAILFRWPIPLYLILSNTNNTY